jgi:hypothetical protein
MYNPITVFSDNMDAGSVSTKWNVSGGWNYTSAYSVSSTRSLTESPSGNYSASTTREAALANPVDLSDATIAYISFWTRHRAENFRDILRLQISTNSTDGFDGTWTNLAGRTTVQESNTTNQGRLGSQPAITGIKENWTRELIEIPSTFYNSNNVRFRFEFSSDAYGGSSDFEDDTDDGVYIDDFKIVKSTQTLIVLPVKFISFTSQLLTDETIRLNWQAITGQQHDYFEIEKSADGTHFISLGRGTSFAPFWGLDTSPYIGNNFYRIKQADKNGTITYSTVIVVNYQPVQHIVLAYPNPVVDVLSVKINTSSEKIYVIILTDITGRKLFEKKVTGGIKTNIDFSNKASQLYMLTVRDEKNKILLNGKIVKQ